MVFLGEAAVGRLDHFGIRLGINLQDLVRVGRVSHFRGMRNAPGFGLPRAHPSCRRLPDVDLESGRGRPVAEPRQRWRLTFGRSSEAPAATHRELAEAWSAALAATLPLPRSEGSRQRPPLTFAAPLPVGMAAERELADLYLSERLPTWRVREAVCDAAPRGIVVAAVHDEWLGAPALAGCVAAADYRIRLADDPVRDIAAIRAAAFRLLSADTLERRRPRGDGWVSYDLRPLLATVDIDVRDTARPTLRIRTRFHPERGAGRPEEVLAALGEAAAADLRAAEIVRERILLAEDLTSTAAIPGTFDARPT
jgi:radical SAM-linked protein